MPRWAARGARSPYEPPLALAEGVTRSADHADAVPDDVWDEAARHYDEQQLGAFVLTVAHVDLGNRSNVSTRQIAGQEW